MQIDIFTDGGSRGNPGPAACAFVVRQQGATIGQGSRPLGTLTNNEAEYHGFLLSLAWVKDWLPANPQVTQLRWFLDSKLVVEQLNRRWKIKDARMKALVGECWQQLADLSIAYSITHIPRELNAQADALLNQTLDGLS